MGKYLKDSELVNNSYRITYINLNTSLSVDEIGDQGLSKYARIVGLFFKVLVQLIVIRPEFTYMTPSAGGMGFYKDWPLAMICKLFSKKFIVHFHNKGCASFQDSSFDDWLYRRFFKNTDVIILAEELYADVSKYVTRDKIHIIPNGIPEPSAKRANKVESANLNILFLSNLLEEKGIFDLLEAIVLLKADKVPVKCNIVGGEGDISAARLQAKIDKLGISEEATYLGKQYGQVKNTLIQSADIFVFPTYYSKECFPLVLLEAMSFGLPIITTEEGGIPSIIQDNKNGLLVGAKNPKELSFAISKLYNDPQLRSLLGSNARKDFSGKFTLEKFEKNFIGTIDRIVGSV